MVNEASEIHAKQLSNEDVKALIDSLGVAAANAVDVRRHIVGRELAETFTGAAKQACKAIGASWPAGSLVTLLFNERGEIRGVSARQPNGDKWPKRQGHCWMPAGCTDAGLTMANRLGHRLLKGDVNGNVKGVVIVEGAPDLWTWASPAARQGLAVFGTYSGGGSADICAKIASRGVPVYIRTHLDDNGDEYAAKWGRWIRDASPDAELWRLTGVEEDENTRWARREINSDTSPLENCEPYDPPRPKVPLFDRSTPTPNNEHHKPEFVKNRIEHWSSELARYSKGARNNQSNRCAFCVGQWLHYAPELEQTAFSALFDAMKGECDSTFTEGTLKGKINRAFKAADAKRLYAADSEEFLEECRKQEERKQRKDAGQGKESAPSTVSPEQPAPTPADDVHQEESPPLDITITPDIGQAVDGAIQALAQHPDIYKRAGYVARYSDHTMIMFERQSGRHQLREVLSRSDVAVWWRPRSDRDDELRRVECPLKVVDALIDRQGIGLGPLRELRRVSRLPVIRPDGSLLTEPGYDPPTGILYDPADGIAPLRIAENPTREDARKAFETIAALFCDFPFKEGDVGRAAAVAGLMTLVVRASIDGPTPMFLVNATTQGTGKGLLVHTIANIETGKDGSTRSYTQSDDEMRKSITATARKAPSMVFFDNIKGEIGGPSLERAITEGISSDRLLGSNDQPDLAIDWVWFATANGAKISPDMARRIIPVDLQTNHESPYERSGFRHPQLKRYARRPEVRSEIISAVHTIIRAYYRANGIGAQCDLLGSFEAWSEMVRAPITWACGVDPVQAQRAFCGDRDDTTRALGGLLELLHEKHGDAVFTAAEVKAMMAKPEEENPASEARRRALHEHLGNLKCLKMDGQVDTNKLGRAMSTYAGRIIGGRRLVVADENGKKGKLYRVEQGTRGEDGGMVWPDPPSGSSH